MCISELIDKLKDYQTIYGNADIFFFEEYNDTGEDGPWYMFDAINDYTEGCGIKLFKMD